MSWTDDQRWESEWWGDCLNTFGEETKQLTYAACMGLESDYHDGHWPSYNLEGRSVLDVGGGPVSILLKCRNLGDCTVVDPLHVPLWVHRRYRTAGVELVQMSAEGFDLDNRRFDEVWMYNVLQHVQSPEAVCALVREVAGIARVFEWVDMPVSLGHPNSPSATDISKWLVSDRLFQGEFTGENGCVGNAVYGAIND